MNAFKQFVPQRNEIYRLVKSRDQCSCDTHVVARSSSFNPFLMNIICSSSGSVRHTLLDRALLLFLFFSGVAWHLSRQIYELVVVFLSMALCVYLYFSYPLMSESFAQNHIQTGISRRGGSIYIQSCVGCDNSVRIVVSIRFSLSFSFSSFIFILIEDL